MTMTESVVEDAALSWFEGLGYAREHGPDIAPGEERQERASYCDVVLTDRLLKALVRLNPDIPPAALMDAVRKLTITESPSLYENNRRFHGFVTDGIPIQYMDPAPIDEEPSPPPSPKGRGSEASPWPSPNGRGCPNGAGEGAVMYANVQLFDFDDLDNNDWLAVNQFTVVDLPARGAQAGSQENRRPDIVVFVNGLPLAVVELKNAADEKATIGAAFRQIQNYKTQIPSLFTFNEGLVISDGIQARMGSLTADWDRFMPWRTIDGTALNPSPSPRPSPNGNQPSPRPSPNGRGGCKAGEELRCLPELEVLIRGVFDKRRFLDLIRYFTVFEVDGAAIAKKVAGYHQYHAVNKAVGCTVRATSPRGDKRVGVVWHTQGSGKSLSMAFYAGKIIQRPELENPTLVVLTDRNDLDDQLFDTFSQCNALLRQKPVQAESRRHLRELLSVASGGVVFTTLQKFLPERQEPSPQPSPTGRGGYRRGDACQPSSQRSPTGRGGNAIAEEPSPPGRGCPEGAGEGDNSAVLSYRRNIIFIADEAHRSHYGFIKGAARHMRDALPNASFMGWTGTPIEREDRSTPAVFGDYIDIYDIEQAVEDGATVPIYYEGRLAKIDLREDERPKIDPDFEEVTEAEEADTKEKLKSRWSRLEAMVGTERRVGLIAQDIVDHFENRLATLDGKGMIVCMSRRICVDLYHAIVALRPDWHGGDDEAGRIKVVMTGSAADPAAYQPHVRSKDRRKRLATRFKDPRDPFQLVIVRDMWLTGFDAPSLHTMYVDKPMRGCGLMQAIARVNRVFKDKPAGLVVDYLGLAAELRKALSDYTEGDRRNAGIPQEEAVAILLEKYEVICAMLHPFDWSAFFTGTPGQRVGVIPAAMEHVLALEDGKQRYMDAAMALSKAFALAVPHEDALAIKDDVAFFQALKAAFAKHTVGAGKTQEELDTAIRQIVSRAVASTEVVDIFAASGLKKPDISILSDEFLAEMRGMKHKNLALELLRKLLSDEIKSRSRKNLVLGRSFADMLERTIAAYQNRSIAAAEVILELIDLARQMREAQKRGQELGLTEDEVAFYDALEVNDSAVKVLGDETLRTIARELVESVRRNVSIDWTVKQSVRAKLRVLVKRILRHHGYPPDKQEKAIATVLQQAELLCKDWAA